MASSNLDLVRSICAAWERGDYSAAEWADPEIELVVADGPAPGRWKGVAGMAQAHRATLSAFEEFRQEADEYRQLDNGRILVLFSFGGRGKTSGLDLAKMSAPGAGLFHVRDGKVTKFIAYYSRERAIADLGLSPEAGCPTS